MKAKALFLDRDGVINVDKNYVYRVEDFEFCAGIFDLCAWFMARKYEIFVITNQSGIARSFYSEADFEKISTFLLKEFEKRALVIKKIYHCPHLEGCECRKPKPGMILRAADEFEIDLKNSIFIGDNFTDMQAGANAGISTLCLISSDLKAMEFKAEFKVKFGFEFMIFKDLGEILEHFKSQIKNLPKKDEK